MKRIKISEVKIMKCYEETPPRTNKLAKAIANIIATGDVDKPITIDENNVLIDGYSRYLAAKQLGILKDLPYIQSHKNTYTFIQARVANETAYEKGNRTDCTGASYVINGKTMSEKEYINYKIEDAISRGCGCVCLPTGITQKSYSLLTSAGYKVCYIMNPFKENKIEIYTSIDWSDADDWKQENKS